MIDVAIAGGVARVALDRPEKANALSTPMLEALRDALEKLKREPQLRVVVLSGRGRCFCGGADVKELATLTEANAGDFVRRIHEVCATIRALPVPVVAQLHGAAIGAGLEIAAACDLRVAEEGTKFAMPEVRIRIPSVVEAALLPRLMGAGRAAWLVMTGEAIDAKRAAAWGLVEEVGGAEAVGRLVDALLAGDARALAMQKELCRMWDEAPLADSVRHSIALFGAAHAGR